MDSQPGSPVLYWIRDDLRLCDNPVLQAAKQAGPVLCVYILSGEGSLAPGGAVRWWLHHSLLSLSARLEALGSCLVIARGDADAILPQLARNTGARHLCHMKAHSPDGLALETRVREACEGLAMSVQALRSGELVDPDAVLTKQGTPFKTFTSFWKRIRERIAPGPELPEPVASDLWTAEAARNAGLAEMLAGPEALGLLPRRPDWAGGLRAFWTGEHRPGEEGAREALALFVSDRLPGYGAGRDRPDQPATSLLSPHLARGEISPATVWRSLSHAMDAGEARNGRDVGADGWKFLSELAWREYARYLLWHFPDMTWQALNPAFRFFPWQSNDDVLQAWQQGRTGYPMVDAGMRELWQTGMMHNRVRMITGSFLVKHLLQPWQDGERWFRDTLVDADLANNCAGWQWVSGCGVDAAPFFRIFNPILQGQKFDPEGIYVRQWLPELAGLPTPVLHEPWKASPVEQRAAGMSLGEEYPFPIVSHQFARERALESFRSLPR